VRLVAEVEGGQGAGGGAFAHARRAGEDQAMGEAVGGERAAEPGEGLVLVEDGIKRREGHGR
jgi:hypothetical protein